MKRLQRWKTSVLKQYMLSYFGIALLSCCLIGILFFQSMARQMLTTQLEVQQSKLDQVVEDFQVQLDLLEGISHKISISREFRPSYFRMHKYHEVELLQSLPRFVNETPFASEYFLYYNDSDLFYRSTGRSSERVYFIEQYLNLDAEEFLPLLQIGDEVAILSQPNQGRVLLLYPVWTSTARRGNANTVLCFILNEEEMARRVTTVTGGIGGALHVQFGADTLLLQDSVEMSGKLHILESASLDGDVHARLEIHQNALMGGRGLTRIINVAAVILVVLLLLIAAGFFAWQSYLPIRRVHMRITGQTSECGTPNELAGIEEAFESLRQNNQEANQALLDQFRLLRAQLFRGLLNGDNVEGNLVRLGLLGVELTGPYYMALYLCFDTLDGGSLLETIEGLSGETLRFFTVIMDSGRDYAVICSMEEEYQATEAEELLRDVLDARGEHGGIGRGDVYTSPDHIATSYLEAASNLQRWREAKDYDAGYLLRLLHEIRSGNTDAISSVLDAFERHLNACAPTPLAQKYLYTQAISQLAQTVGDWGVPVDPLMLSNVLAARDNHAFREGLDKILWKLAGSLSLQQRGEDSLSVRVLGYIKAHYLDYDLSLDRMAEEFHVTANYLSRLIKSSTAVTYKAYVTNLKIAEAKRLLADGLSVAETANRLGYSSASHFIRIFRQTVDVTPSVYQKQHRPGQ